MRIRALVLTAPAVLAPALLLGACGSIRAATATPQLTPIAYPAALVPTEQRVLSPTPEPSRPASSNSLWRNGARAFFHDQRAARVGDILTVQIDINDNAKLQNQSTTSRKSSTDAGVTHIFGLEKAITHLLPNHPDPAHLVTTGSTSSNDGQGAVARSEAVSLTIAAVVTGVLPNGNLVIQGRQEVRINQEMRELTVGGIVRPEDISSSNTIKHTQIAEARVSYGGQGQVSRVQGTPAGQALIERFSPF